jgi:hypothetical protein
VRPESGDLADLALEPVVVAARELQAANAG